MVAGGGAMVAGGGTMVAGEGTVVSGEGTLEWGDGPGAGGEGARAGGGHVLCVIMTQCIRKSICDSSLIMGDLERKSDLGLQIY